MNNLGFDLNVAQLPPPADRDASDRGQSRWLESIRNLDDSELTKTAESVTADPNAKALIDAVFGNAPFLVRCAAQSPKTMLNCLVLGPEAVWKDAVAKADALRRTRQPTDMLKRELRVLKRQAALSIAIADVAGLWTLEKVTRSVSDFADSTLKAATGHVLRVVSDTGAFQLPDSDDSEIDSGFVCMALGKLGARELNYSSDVDLVMFFDPDRIKSKDPSTLQSKFTRVARDILSMMSERTSDGYVFRVDLRLRPDPGATPLCVSLPAAEAYYESQGQNWERAAYIKARPVAGDLAAGQALVDHLRPFVWRKSLDFYAIQDIHSIKRQINAHRGGSTVALAGHNIKLGRGGIREIEFFVQIQQLIWGGRNTALRAPSTPKSLEALYEADLISKKARDELLVSYTYLRTLEHRLQMREDEQTQTLPTDPSTLAALANFMGYETLELFSDDLLGHLRCVEHHYAELFEDQPSLGATGDGTVSALGSLVFTGSEAEAETLETLSNIGFAAPDTVHETVRSWHHGRYRAMRTVRSREILTEITPDLLTALAATPDPDVALRAFDSFLEALPAGIQLFSMFQANPQLLDFLATIMGEAPRLAQALAKSPHLLDGLLSAEFLKPPPRLNVLARELARALSQAAPLNEGGLEDVLSISRRWVHERQFQIGLQTLQGVIEPHDAAWALSRIAEASLSRLQATVETEFAARGHGYVTGSGMVTIAYGKLGGHEITPQSDLDLVFVYDLLTDIAESDGRKPLAPSQYFARLGQRYISAITTLTPEGKLYEVDMRLRPSGNSGPIACTLESLERYYANDAWTWELMALTRARPVSGPKDLRNRVKELIHTVLCQQRDAEALRKDVVSMRDKIRKQHGTNDPWAVKHRPGGLVDIEFTAQFLQLRDAHSAPNVLSANTWGAISNLAEAGSLTTKQAGVLKTGLDLWQRVQSVLHLTMDKTVSVGDVEKLPKALRQQLARHGGVHTVSDLESRMADIADAVFAVHTDILGPFDTHEQT